MPLIILHAKSLQSCPTLCDPMDCSPSGSLVHGILQARILEWVAMPSSSRPQTVFVINYLVHEHTVATYVLYHGQMYSLF